MGFRRQLDRASVIDRINTLVGFYTRVVIDRARCTPLNLSGKGAQFDVEGVDHGLGIVVWGEDGYLATIEGFTNAGRPLQGVDLAQLNFVAVQPV